MCDSTTAALESLRVFRSQIKMCETCQNAEHNKNMARKVRLVKVESPWEVLGLDIHGKHL